LSVRSRVLDHGTLMGSGPGLSKFLPPNVGESTTGELQAL
jgi:hypothetical protein